SGLSDGAVIKPYSVRPSRLARWPRWPPPGGTRAPAGRSPGSHSPGPRAARDRTTRGLEARDLLGEQAAPLAGGQGSECESADGHPDELEDVVADRRAHPPDLAVLPLA